MTDFLRETRFQNEADIYHLPITNSKVYIHHQFYEWWHQLEASIPYDTGSLVSLTVQVKGAAYKIVLFGVTIRAVPTCARGKWVRQHTLIYDLTRDILKSFVNKRVTSFKILREFYGLNHRLTSETCLIICCRVARALKDFRSSIVYVGRVFWYNSVQLYTAPNYLSNAKISSWCHQNFPQTVPN